MARDSQIKNGEVSFWWSRVGRPEPHPALAESLSADVAIVGAGYTGLWTAYYVKKAEPSLRVVLLERRFAGYGASGRNGGWLTNSITGGREQYIPRFGREAAARFQAVMNDAVDEVIRVTKAESIDADIVKGGEFTVARNQAQLRRLLESADAEQNWAESGVEILSAEEAANRIRIDKTLGALWHPHCARLQPAKLAAGLTRAVVKLGVELYEGTEVLEITPHQAITARGTVTASAVVRATEGFTAGLKGMHRDWLPLNSSLVITEPLPQPVWDEIGWEGRQTLGDQAHVYMYAQRTADDRIAFGGRGKPYRYGSHVDTDGRTPQTTVALLRGLIESFWPILRDVTLDHAWSGVLGVPRDWSPTVSYNRSTGIAKAGGYVGTGVTTTNLAGRTLTDLILERSTELTSLPWVGHRAHKWEPEPLRYLAVALVYGCYNAADRAEDAGRATDSPLARIADLVSGH